MADNKQNNSDNNISYAGKTCQGQWMSEEYKPGLVSVIIPTYNRADLVRRAIQSALNQTYQNFEIIVVDDGSIDNTEEVVQSFKDPRICYIRHKENRGAPFARNYGAKIANGEYISLLDSDDYYLPNKLTVQIDAFKSDSDAGLVYSNILEERSNTKRRIKYDPKTFKSGYLFEKVVLKSVHCRLPTWLIRREFFISIGGFDEELPKLQDRDFIVRFSYRYKLLSVPEPVAVVVFHKGARIGGASAEVNEYACNRVLDKISRLVEAGGHSPILIKKMTSLYYYIIGRAYLKEGNFSKGRYYLIHAFYNRPLDYKIYPYLVGLLNKNFFSFLRQSKKYFNTLRKICFKNGGK